MIINSNSQKQQIKKGTRVKCTTVHNMGAGKTRVTENFYTVTGHRNAPNGLRIRMKHDLGYGLTDVNFEYVPTFADAAVSITWETVE